MIPIADESPKGYFPFVNYIFIATNIFLFIFWQKQNADFYMMYGLVPSHFLQAPFQPQSYLNVFTSMFMHGGWMHLLGNMLYLWIFGDNIEYTVGHIRYFFFYLVVGITAAFSQVLAYPASVVPMIGASGAISGVLGAYLIKYPKNKISILFFFIIFIKVVRIPAAIVLSLWFAFQLISGYINFHPGSAEGVAWFAHVGGFITGLVLIKLFEKYPKR